MEKDPPRTLARPLTRPDPSGCGRGYPGTMDTDIPGTYCQNCFTWNPGERETCRKCGTRLLIVTGDQGWEDEEEEADAGDDLDEHLLERITGPGGEPPPHRDLPGSGLRSAGQAGALRGHAPQWAHVPGAADGGAGPAGRPGLLHPLGGTGGGEPPAHQRPGALHPLPGPDPAHRQAQVHVPAEAGPAGDLGPAGHGPAARSRPAAGPGPAPGPQELRAGLHRRPPSRRSPRTSRRPRIWPSGWSS